MHKLVLPLIAGVVYSLFIWIPVFLSGLLVRVFFSELPFMFHFGVMIGTAAHVCLGPLTTAIQMRVSRLILFGGLLNAAFLLAIVLLNRNHMYFPSSAAEQLRAFILAGAFVLAGAFSWIMFASYLQLIGRRLLNIVE